MALVLYLQLIVFVIYHVSVDSVIQFNWIRLFHWQSFYNYFCVRFYHSTFLCYFYLLLRIHVLSQSLDVDIFVFRLCLRNLVRSFQNRFNPWINRFLSTLRCFNINKLNFINFFRSGNLILFSWNLQLFTGSEELFHYFIVRDVLRLKCKLFKL